MKWAQKFGIQTDYIKEDELKDGDCKNYDLILSIGGDSTYLKTAG
jgi:NAD kinase